MIGYPGKGGSSPLKRQTQKEKLSQNSKQYQKLIVEEISEINVLREDMLKEATNFTNELDELENKLVRKANELEILTSKEMGEISDRNLALVQEFVNYQESFIKKLQGKYSDWDKFELEMSEVQGKLNDVMDRNELVPKLALIEIMEGEIEKLIEEVEQLKEHKENRRR